MQYTINMTTYLGANTHDQIVEIYRDLQDIEHTMDQMEGMDTNGKQRTIANVVEAIAESVNNKCEKQPQKHYNRYMKPYWNETLKMLNREKKNARNHWKAGGMTDASKEHNIYKNSKKAFEVAIKCAKRKYETQK